MLKNYDSIWAIEPEAAHAVLQLVARDLDPHSSGTLAIEARSNGPLSRPIGSRIIAIVPIHGILTNNGPSYYGTNYRGIGDAVEKAAADPNVKRIILSVDSPGGEVLGLTETAGVIAAAAKIKPVSAMVEGRAGSAAYWLTSQATDITLTPSGEVGSVGIRVMHVDMSKMLEAEGYTVTELHAGVFKTEGSPYKPLSDEAKAHVQSRINAMHADFLSAVSTGRGRRPSAAIRQSSFGGGRMLQAPQALTHGLVDRVQAAREFYRSVATGSADANHLGPNSTTRARLELAACRERVGLR